MRSVVLWFVAICLIVALVCLVVFSQIYFAQNCRKAHTETYTYYTSECVIWLSGRCQEYAISPHIGTTQVCDEWKETK